MRIGIFGGSFNPIHNQHISIIKELLKKKLVDEVWILPCKKHAFNKALASEKHRIKMIKLATKNIKKVKICYAELKSKKAISYTADTIKKLKIKYPYQFFLIIGSDILHEIKKWQKYKQLLKQVEFIISKRKNYPIIKIKGLKIKYLVRLEATNISSTEIRKKIKEGKPLKNLVPSPVEEYIKKHGLYKKT